jgi:hypothetical protein
LAVAEARLLTAKLLWKFDMELDGAHDDWVEEARFYVSGTSSGCLPTRLSISLVTGMENGSADIDSRTDPMATAATDDQAEGCEMI